MSQSLPGHLGAAGSLETGYSDPYGDGPRPDEAGDATADAMCQAQRTANWASMHAGPPGTVVPPMPDDFQPCAPAPFSAAYYAQLNAQNAPAPQGTSVPSAPGGGTYYNPPAPAPRIVTMPRFSAPPRAIVPTYVGTPALPPPQSTSSIGTPPSPLTPPPGTSIDTSTPSPSGGGGGATGTDKTPWLIAGGVVLGLLYFGRKKKRGR